MADGDDVRDLVPDDSHIRLIHIEPGYTIGQKRNFGVAQARGDLIAHWDDDDRSSPVRLAQQVSMLEESGCAVAGYSAMYFTNGSAWWLFNRSGYGIGSSLCYHREWASAHPFQSLQVGEDSAFVTEANERKQLVACEAGSLMVASIHPGNTSPRSLEGSNWFRVERPESICSPFD